MSLCWADAVASAPNVKSARIATKATVLLRAMMALRGHEVVARRSESSTDNLISGGGAQALSSENFIFEICANHSAEHHPKWTQRGWTSTSDTTAIVISSEYLSYAVVGVHSGASCFVLPFRARCTLPLLLLVPAPFQGPYSPAPRFYAVLESSLADPLRAEM